MIRSRGSLYVTESLSHSPFRNPDFTEGRASSGASTLFSSTQLRSNSHHLIDDANIADDGQVFCGISLAYNARTREEVDAVMAEAQAAGTSILKPATTAFWSGYSGYFSDLDGFSWEVAWNPSFPLAEDGGIRIPD